MDLRAIVKGESRLRSAKAAVTRLQEAKSLVEFGDHWYEFLVSSKNIWTVLEQGSKGTPQSRQWFGAKKAERRGDELLRYLYQARNDDEHGLESSLKEVPGSTAIGVAAQGFSSAMEFSGSLGPGGRLSVRSLDGKPVLISNTPAQMRLTAVKDRDPSIVHAPPTTHLGISIGDNAPIPVANLGLAYLEALLSDAKSRV